MSFLSVIKTKRSKSSSSLPRPYALSSDSLTVTTMSMTSNSTSGSRPTSRHYDTGFPDSFAARTTSLRHPDAILDPSFAISAEHVDPAKTLHRSRKSLLRKHRRTISHGTIPNGDLDHNELLKSTTMLSTTDSAVDIAEPESNNMNADIGRPSKDSMESSSRAQGPERTSPVSPGFQYTADGREPSREEHRKSNIFRKWRNKD